jgi:hypothetical protein
MAKKTPPPVTDEQRVKAFLKHLNENAFSKSPGEKFRDWCELAYCAWAKPTAPTQERADELEARYMSIVERYRRTDEELEFIRHSSTHMAALAQLAVQGGGVDFLGDVAGQLEILNPNQGQFFTPYEVSRFMAEINLDGLEAIIERDGYVTICEPAAGAGSMILACADVFEKKGLGPETMLVQATDVSALAFYMCFLQLNWRGIPAAVIRGNTLSLEVFESAWTVAALTTFLPHHGHLSFSKPNREPLLETNSAPVEVETVVERAIGSEPVVEHEAKLVQLSFF